MERFYCMRCQDWTETRVERTCGLPNGCEHRFGRCARCGSKVSRIGKGVLNAVMNKLPLPEMHMSHEEGESVPGGSFNGRRKYSYCGPFTRLKRRQREGYKGVNSLDEACKRHDVAYSEEKDRESRNAHDDVLALRAAEIANDPSKSASERADARKVVALIGSKSWLRV